MPVAAVTSLAGLAVTLVGAVLLAFSLNRLFQELLICLQFVDVTVGSLCAGGDVPRFEGINTRLQSGVRSAKARTIAGVALVAVGSLLQLVGFLLAR